MRATHNDRTGYLGCSQNRVSLQDLITVAKTRSEEIRRSIHSSTKSHLPMPSRHSWPSRHGWVPGRL
jgi:hypothetical protein